MKQIYDIPETDFLKYNSLKHNIPTDWKTKLSQTKINNENNKNILEKLKHSKHINKFLYTFQENNNNVVKAEIKLNLSFLNEELKWDSIYKTAITTSIDIKIKSFQYKFLHRIFPTNRLLMK